MATLSNKSLPCRIPIGAKVLSKKIGKRDEFVGTVTEYFGDNYHVRDDQGRGWLRSPREIKLIDGDAA